MVLAAGTFGIDIKNFLTDVKPDFEVELYPNSGIVEAGGTVKANIIVKSVNNYDKSVNFTAIPPDGDISLDFKPYEKIPNTEFCSNIKITVDENVKKGIYPIPIYCIGDDNKKHICSYSLEVTEKETENEDMDNSLKSTPDNYIDDSIINDISENDNNNGNTIDTNIKQAVDSEETTSETEPDDQVVQDSDPEYVPEPIITITYPNDGADYPVVDWDIVEGTIYNKPDNMYFWVVVVQPAPDRDYYPFHYSPPINENGKWRVQSYGIGGNESDGLIFDIETYLFDKEGNDAIQAYHDACNANISWTGMQSLPGEYKMYDSISVIGRK